MISKLINYVKEYSKDLLYISLYRSSMSVIKVFLYLFEDLSEFKNTLEHTHYEILKSKRLRLVKESKRLLDLNNVKFDDLPTNVFNNCCEAGNLEIVKWCFEIHKIKINDIRYQDIFDSCCKDDSLDVARYLYEKSCEDGNIKIDIKHKNNKVFKNACIHGHHKTVKWLYEESVRDNIKIDIHQDDESAFNIACKFGYLDIAKWLYDISMKDNNIIDIRILDDRVFRESCCENQLEVVEWLCSLIPGYSYDVDDKKIYYGIRSLKNDLKDLKYHVDFDDQIKKLFNENNYKTYYDDIDCCPICLSDDEHHQVEFSCNHRICVRCFCEYDRCYLKCKQKYGNNIKLIKYEKQ
jgi:hypothetical protein